MAKKQRGLMAGRTVQGQSFGQAKSRTSSGEVLRTTNPADVSQQGPIDPQSFDQTKGFDMPTPPPVAKTSPAPQAASGQLLTGGLNARVPKPAAPGIVHAASLRTPIPKGVGIKHSIGGSLPKPNAVGINGSLTPRLPKNKGAGIKHSASVATTRNTNAGRKGAGPNAAFYGEF